MAGIFPKYIFCYKNGQVITRPVVRYVTSATHMDDGKPGPTRAIPFLEPGETMLYDSMDKIHIFGSWHDRKIFIDQGLHK